MDEYIMEGKLDIMLHVWQQKQKVEKPLPGSHKYRKWLEANKAKI